MRVGYVRVSDDEQTEALQIDALTAAGCDVIYGDHGVSGAIIQRQGLDDVLALLQPGDSLAVWKLDRLGRSTIHLLLLLDGLRRRGVDFVSTTQGIDTSTPIGRLLYGQLALFAEFERELISERTRAGMAAAKARGVHVGRPYALSNRKLRSAHRRMRTEKMCLAELGRSLAVSEATLRRGFSRLGLREVLHQRSD